MIIKSFQPFPNLETKRLYLSEIQVEHLQDLYAILGNPEVAKHDYFYPAESVDQVMEFIERYRREKEAVEEITWGIFEKDSKGLIGTCCLGSFSEGARRAEIGYSVAQKVWGRGYGTEALKEVIAYGFEVMNLNRIEATITPGNEASVRVLEKNGFTKEGIVRERDLIKGQLVDGIIMAKLKKEHV